MAIYNGTITSSATTVALSDVFDMTNCTGWDTSTTGLAVSTSSNMTTYITGCTFTCNPDPAVWDPGPVFTPDAAIRQIKMADGSIIHIEANGDFRIEDAAAKVTYKANRMRNFNPYVNAGDMLARFIDYVRVAVPGIRRSDIPGLPLQVFVHWLILEAASRDGDPAPADAVPVPESRMLTARVRPQCRLPICRRYIPRISIDTGFNYCNPRHAAAHGRLLAA